MELLSTSKGESERSHRATPPRHATAPSRAVFRGNAFYTSDAPRHFCDCLESWTTTICALLDAVTSFLEEAGCPLDLAKPLPLFLELILINKAHQPPRTTPNNLPEQDTATAALAPSAIRSCPSGSFPTISASTRAITRVGTFRQTEQQPRCIYVVLRAWASIREHSLFGRTCSEVNITNSLRMTGGHLAGNSERD